MKAVRTLHDYVSHELKKDLKNFAHYLQQDLNRSILRPAGWKDLCQRKDGDLYSSPAAVSPGNQLIPKWRVADDDEIEIQIYLDSPVGDDYGPCVCLVVPAKWDNRGRFVAELKAPPGFEHASEYAQDELDEESSVFKYVPYEDSLRSGGGFDATAFIQAFRDATKAVVAMEAQVDTILGRLAKESSPQIGASLLLA